MYSSNFNFKFVSPSLWIFGLKNPAQLYWDYDVSFRTFCFYWLNYFEFCDFFLYINKLQLKNRYLAQCFTITIYSIVIYSQIRGFVKLATVRHFQNAISKNKVNDCYNCFFQCCCLFCFNLCCTTFVDCYICHSTQLYGERFYQWKSSKSILSQTKILFFMWVIIWFF